MAGTARCVQRLFPSRVLPRLARLGRRQSQWLGSAVAYHGGAVSCREPADALAPARLGCEDARRRLPLHYYCTRNPRDPSTVHVMVPQDAAAGRRWPRWIMLGGVFSFLKRGKKEEEEEEVEGQVPLAVKRALLKAQRALSDLDYERAEQAYHEALGLLMLSPSAATQPFVEATAVVLDLLANFYLQQGRLDEAEANFKETIKVMMAAGVTQEDPAIVEISLKLSMIYANQKNYELAGTGFEWCVETARKNSSSKTEDDLALLGMCVHAKAQFHRMAGQDLQAAEAYKEALKIAEEVYGPKHLQVAVVHNDLSAVLCNAEDYSAAEEQVRASLAIASSLDQSYELREAMATFYCNLGVIMAHQGRSAEASEAFESAMQEAKKTKDKNLVDTVKFHTVTNTQK